MTTVGKAYYVFVGNRFFRQRVTDKMREVKVGDLITVKEFYEWVKDGLIIGDDGGVNGVFVDGYETNILPEWDDGGYTDGCITFSEKKLKSLAKRHDVKVWWIND